MAENNFEEHVQQKMEELNFHPSDAVWTRVEKEIASKRKRRLLIIWLPLLCLLMGAVAWYYYAGAGLRKTQGTDEAVMPAAAESNRQQDVLPGSEENKKPVSKFNSASYPKQAEKMLENRVLPTDKEDAVDRSEKRDIANSLPVSESTTTGSANTKNYPGTNAAAIKPHAAYGVKNATQKTNIPKAYKRRGAGLYAKQADGAAAFELIAGSAAANKAINKTAQVTTLVDETRITATVTILPGANAPTDTSMTQGNNHAYNTSAATKTAPAHKRKAMQWGISADAGIANISNGFPALSSVNPSYSVYSNDLQGNNLTSVNSPTGVNNSAFTAPSPVRPGLAFTAGVLTRLPLRKNLNLLVALHYNYSSTQMTIGAKIDSNKAITQYHTGSGGGYSNRFHFIALPIMLQQQFGNNLRFSVDGGFLFSMLAGSNALQYDAQKNIYYTDNSRINKLQMGLQAGVNYRLLQKTVQLEAGPMINYHFTSLFDKSLYGSRHLFFAGISTKIYFLRKKH